MNWWMITALGLLTDRNIKMLNIKKTNALDKDFIELVKALDAALKIYDGEQHDFYDQYNKIDTIKYALVAYENGEPVGCGAIKTHGMKSMEIKRMYVKPDFRGRGIATKMLIGLEDWAKALSFEKCILETGKRQVEAINLYQNKGYTIIPNYGQYKGVENSLCFEKIL